MRIAFTIISLFLASASFAQDGWTQKTGFPAEGRHRTTGWSIGNKGYIGLGHYNSGPMGNVVKADIWEYDPTSDSWTQKADYGGGGTYGASAFTIGNFAYVGAHVYGQGEFYKFDPIQNSWELIAHCPNSQSDMTSFAVNGKGYHVTQGAIYEYDPQLDQWSLKDLMPSPVGSWSKSFVVGSKAYILGSNSGTMYEYKPSTGDFATREPYPGDAIGGWITFETETKGYVATGYISFLNPTSRQIWEFNPELNEWQKYADLPGSTRRFAASFSINGKGYLGAGTNGNNYKDLWEFDPAEAVALDKQSEDVVSIYPNPSSEIITVSIPNGQANYKLEIIDMTGRLLYQEIDAKDQIILNVSEFGKGIFLYRISRNNFAIQTGKLIFE